MTAEEFRRIAISLPEAFEDEHMGHPDFRVLGKIFATLGPEERWGMETIGLALLPARLRVEKIPPSPRPPQATHRLVDLDMIDATSERTIE